MYYVYCYYLQEIKPGGVLNKKNLWEGLSDTFGKEGKVSIHTHTHMLLDVSAGQCLSTVMQ